MRSSLSGNRSNIHSFHQLQEVTIDEEEYLQLFMMSPFVVFVRMPGGHYYLSILFIFPFDIFRIESCLPLSSNVRVSSMYISINFNGQLKSKIHQFESLINTLHNSLFQIICFQRLFTRRKPKALTRSSIPMVRHQISMAQTTQMCSPTSELLYGVYWAC